MSLTDRQRQIVEASVTLIARKGIQELTMKKLATMLRITEPAIYRHFESKARILLAILDFFQEESGEVFRGAQDTGLSPLREAEVGVEADGGRGRIPWRRLFAEDLFRNDPRLTARVVRMMQEGSRRFETMVERGVRQGEIRSDVAAEQIVQILVGSLRLLVTRWRLGGVQARSARRRAPVVGGSADGPGLCEEPRGPLGGVAMPSIIGGGEPRGAGGD